MASRKLPIRVSNPSRPQESPGPEARRFPIVGVGASAGGLEAASILFKQLAPNLGIAYVLVLHLDPARKSAIREILGRVTQMPVLQVEDKTRVETDHVYVIPPNCDMTIEDGVLHLRDREERRFSNTTIDTFLRSLAAAHGSDAIGVILSGTASDGSLGLAAIKGEGGITFAQEPASAKYDGMPASAIALGCVDFVLPPAGIAEEIARIRFHPYIAERDKHEAAVLDNEGEMELIFRLLRRLTRVDFSGYKSPTIARRIQRRMALRKIETLHHYGAFLQSDPTELTSLYQDLLINVTSFFRNPDAFEALKGTVYSAILEARNKHSGPIRIWVPGCSTGEETYSHAIALMEFLERAHLDIPVQVFGTDLSDGTIQRARAGVYKENIEADVSPIRLRRFFHKSDTGYQIKKAIRDLCIFSTQNVVSDPPFSRMDLISCRNVMIYLSQPLQKRVIPIFHYALNPTGFLMLGNTEGLLGAGSELFEMSDKKQKIFRKRLVPNPVAFGLSVGKTEVETEPAPSRSSSSLKAPDPHRAPMELQREADRLLLARYVPPAVLINHELEILQTRGRTASFLELPPGKASLNLLKMARPGLLFELQSAIEEAREKGHETIREGVRIEDDGKSRTVTVRVVPFKVPTHSQSSFLIVFESGGPAESASTGVLLPNSVSATTNEALILEPLAILEQSNFGRHMAQLRQELAATREYLQSIIESQEGTNEELQSANEEIQSGNEELQSANEELQTSKEELESANEELHTVNEEMQHRNELLGQLNNDLTNLLYSVNLPIVMLGAELAVRRFTPQAAIVLGLSPSDIGRPMPRLRLKIDMGSLEHTLLEVIQEVQSRQLNVQDNDGKWSVLRIVPYRTMDNRIDGVVISVVSELGSLPDKPKDALAGKAKKSSASASKTKSKRKL